MKLREPLYIVAGARTPYSKMGTLLADKAADELGRLASAEVLARTGFDPAQIEEVIFGCVAQPAESANVGRVIGLRAGVPQHVPGITVHRNCASGFEAITQAAEKLNAGRGQVFLVGGAENMSQVPLLYSQANVKKFGVMARAKTAGDRVKAMLAFRPGELLSPVIGLQLGLTDPVCGLNMGQTAENIARDFKISRQEADEFSLRSHHRAIAAREKLREEIVPALLSGKDGSASVMQDDNGPRDGQSMEALAKLKPVFEKGTGTVTAGNASQITDGAVALLVMSESALQKSGLQPLGRLVAFDYAGCDPTRMGLGPVFALNRVEQQTGLSLKDADLIEINEAFAAQVLGCQRAAKSDEFGRKYLGRDGALGEIPDEILNVNGGAVALGHPVGSSGARLVLTALKELKRRNGKRAVVTLCVGGGQGGALWLETV